MMSKNAINYAFFILLALWLALYVTCTRIPYFKTFKPEDIRIPLNISFAILVLIVTYVDRYFRYKPCNENQAQFPETKDLFLPFGLALMPLTSSMFDLGDAKANNEFIYSLILMILSSITIVETTFLCNFQQNNTFMRRFILHIVLACALSGAALL
ncbi:hypothetical protein DFO56_10494 [Kosakonia sp. AG348]|nr:hypothetical protein DFO56_10494 [Kosakonia sp. AG348]